MKYFIAPLVGGAVLIPLAIYSKGNTELPAQGMVERPVSRESCQLVLAHWERNAGLTLLPKEVNDLCPNFYIFDYYPQKVKVRIEGSIDQYRVVAPDHSLLPIQGATSLASKPSFETTQPGLHRIERQDATGWELCDTVSVALCPKGYQLDWVKKAATHPDAVKKTLRLKFWFHSYPIELTELTGSPQLSMNEVVYLASEGFENHPNYAQELRGHRQFCVLSTDLDIRVQLGGLDSEVNLNATLGSVGPAILVIVCRNRFS